MPVHVSDANQVQTNGCFVPLAPAIAISTVQFGIADYLAGGTNASGVTCNQVLGPNGAGFCTFTVAVQAPPSGSGMIYVNVHLDYGLKGPMVDANPANDGLLDRYDRGAVASPWSSYDAYVNEPEPTTLSTLAIYKHTGKPAQFTVIVGGNYGLSQVVTLRATGWVEVNFDAETGTFVVIE